MIYGERGFLAIRGDKDKPALVPEGDWKLLNYTITETVARSRPSRPKKKPAEKSGSAVSALTGALSARFGGSSGVAVPSRRGSRWSRHRRPRTARRSRSKRGRRSNFRSARPTRLGVQHSPLPDAAGGSCPGDVVDRFGRRGMLQHHGRRRPAGEAGVHDHRPERPGRPRGQLRVWLRLRLPVLVASTNGAGESVSRPREDDGGPFQDRAEQRQPDSANRSGCQEAVGGPRRESVMAKGFSLVDEPGRPDAVHILFRSIRT